jgi:hypothetical protein
MVTFPQCLQLATAQPREYCSVLLAPLATSYTARRRRRRPPPRHAKKINKKKDTKKKKKERKKTISRCTRRKTTKIPTNEKTARGEWRLTCLFDVCAEARDGDGGHAVAHAAQALEGLVGAALVTRHQVLGRHVATFGRLLLLLLLSSSS